MRLGLSSLRRLIRCVDFFLCWGCADDVVFALFRSLMDILAGLLWVLSRNVVLCSFFRFALPFAV